MKKILVTGGAGFVGSNLLEELSRDKNNCLTSLDSYFTGKEENHVDGVNYIRGFTWNIDQIFENQKFDIIYHFGEYSRIATSFNDINILNDSILKGTPKVFEYARKNKSKVIYSASSSKFGNQGKDENLSPYAWMKSKMVELLINYRNWFNLEYEICYFFNVYGPKQISTGNYATVVGIFMDQFKNNQKITVVRPGSQTRDFTHIQDIVSGLVKATSINLNHEWFFRSGKSISIIELADLFGEWIFIPERKGERLHSANFESDTNSLLEWQPKIDIVKWVNNNKNGF